MRARVVAGTFSPSVALRVARQLGWLDAADLEVEEVPVRSSPEQFRALIDGALDVALTNPDNVLAYRFWPDNPLSRTADVAIVAGIDRGLGLGLYARRGLHPDQLGRAGLTVGVDVSTSGFAFVLYAIAESLGLNRSDQNVLALGSTPKRLEALVAGRCDITMLNAGNELRAEAAGCRLLARVTDVVSPYLGTVLAVVGDDRLDAARRLAGVFRRTAVGIVDGTLDEIAAHQARAALDLNAVLARRYVAGLKSKLDGLVTDEVTWRSDLSGVVQLRRRYHPGNVDWLDAAMAADSGLVRA